VDSLFVRVASGGELAGDLAWSFPCCGQPSPGQPTSTGSAWEVASVHTL